MSPKKRKARQRIPVRQEIIRAATELVVKKGVENVSIRRIADKLNYSPTTIYSHFRDKEELLEELRDRTFAQLAQILLEIREQDADPIERLKRALLAYIKFGLDHPHQYTMALLTPFPRHSYPDCPDIADSAAKQAFDVLRKLVHSCIAAGNFPTEDTEIVSQTLWAGIHGLASRLTMHSENLSRLQKQQLTQSMVQTLVAGLSN